MVLGIVLSGSAVLQRRAESVQQHGISQAKMPSIERRLARFDRHDRRDKGIFRLGQLWLLDILRRTKNRAAVKWCLPFKKLAHGWRFCLRF